MFIALSHHIYDDFGSLYVMEVMEVLPHKSLQSSLSIIALMKKVYQNKHHAMQDCLR